MTTSAHFGDVGHVADGQPGRLRLARDRLVAGSPTRTLTPLSFRFSACACPCDPYPITPTLLPVDQRQIGGIVVIHRRHYHLLESHR